MSDRTELLKQWTKLAPEECEVWSHGIRPEFRFIALGAVVDMGDFHDEAVLLLAVIKAIRARPRWYFTMQSTEYGVLASVNSVVRNCATKLEPCDALLEAYVSSLLAVKGK